MVNKETTVWPRQLNKPVIIGVVLGLLAGGGIWQMPLAADAAKFEAGQLGLVSNHGPQDDLLAWSQTPLRGPLVRNVGSDEDEMTVDVDPQIEYVRPLAPEVFDLSEPMELTVDLVGVAMDGTGESVGFFRGEEGRVRVLGVGEAIDGATVESITIDHAVLLFDGRAVEVRLPEPNEATSFPTRWGVDVSVNGFEDEEDQAELPYE